MESLSDMQVKWKYITNSLPKLLIFKLIPKDYCFTVMSRNRQTTRKWLEVPETMDNTS